MEARPKLIMFSSPMGGHSLGLLRNLARHSKLNSRTSTAFAHILRAYLRRKKRPLWTVWTLYSCGERVYIIRWCMQSSIFERLVVAS